MEKLSQPFLDHPQEVKEPYRLVVHEDDHEECRKVRSGPEARLMRLHKGRLEPAGSYCGNAISTAKYTWYNFLPVSIFRQFRRLGNQYFLLQCVVMVLGEYTRLYPSPLKSWSQIAVLSFVLGLSVLFEARDDLFRHKKDREVNKSPCQRVGFDYTINDEDERAWDPKNYIEKWGVATVEWSEIRVADLVVVFKDEQVAADLVVLATSDDNGLAYVETSNIDGETNLKIRSSVLQSNPNEMKAPDIDLNGDLNDTLTALADTEMTATVETPNPSLDKFTARLDIASLSSGRRSLGLSRENLLIRGSVVRNTSWMVGLCVYTGNDSKIMQNATETPSKLSNIDKILNQTLYIIVFAQTVLVTGMDLASLVWKHTHLSTKHDGGYQGNEDYVSAWYLLPDGSSERTYVFPSWLANWLAFFILFNNFVPINLYVILDFVNMLQAIMINNDLKMYHEDTDTPATCRSTNLCQELGQVQHIFSDKTGTLTQNKMVFRMCAIGEELYGTMPESPSTDRSRKVEMGAGRLSETRIGGASFRKILLMNQEKKEVPRVIEDFFVCLSVAHTVVRDDEGALQAESPDEAALVAGAMEAGYHFVARKGNLVTIRVDGEASERTYTILALNSFTSKRKRMSVVVRCPNGEVRLLLKGADSAVFERLKPPESKGDFDTAAWRSTIRRRLDDFAVHGLRTLALACTTIPEEEYKSWKLQYDKATASLTDRDKSLEKVAEEIEGLGTLTLLGATGIEDKLQDGVPEAIRDIQAAGITFWVLTGDKRETAINIGYSSGVLLENSVLYELGLPSDAKGKINPSQIYHDQLSAILMKQKETGDSVTTSHGKISRSQVPGPAHSIDIKSINDVKSSPVQELSHEALVVTGKALEHILASSRLRGMFLRAAKPCQVVIACRVSPKHKSALVVLVRRNIKPEPITLSIGDGANDVGMIRAAHIGIGISGREGRQAVNASDFGIGQFRFLKRLLLVHGRWNYRRICKVIAYVFYKNFTLTLTMLIYACMAGISGTSLYESLMYNGFNFFTMFPIVAVGCMDQDVRAETVEAFPVLYVSGRLSLDLNAGVIVENIVTAIIHAVIVVLVPYLSYSGLDQAGVGGLYVFGTMVFSCLVFLMQYRVMLLTATFTKYTTYSLIVSFVLYFTFLLSYGVMDFLSWEFYKVPYEMMSAPVFWIVLFGVPGTALYFDFLAKYVRRELFPTLMDIATEADYEIHGASDSGENGGISRMISGNKQEDRMISLKSNLEVKNPVDSRQFSPQSEIENGRTRNQRLRSRFMIFLGKTLKRIVSNKEQEGRKNSMASSVTSGPQVTYRRNQSGNIGRRAVLHVSSADIHDRSPKVIITESKSDRWEEKDSGFSFSHPGKTYKRTLTILTNPLRLKKKRCSRTESKIEVSNSRLTGEPTLTQEDWNQNRPFDNPFFQQTLQRWQEPLTPKIIIITLFVTSLAFILLGSLVIVASNGSRSVTVTYDGVLSSSYGINTKKGSSSLHEKKHITRHCTIGSYDKGGRVCNVSFIVHHKMKAPVFVSYLVTNLYQNYYTYKKGHSVSQLTGKSLSTEDCAYYTTKGKQTYYPCGLAARSIFNDTYVLLNPDITIHTDNIAWPGDRYKYKNVQNYPNICGNEAICLNDTYPDIPELQEQGVTSEKFMVWNRLAALPDFMKRWGRIEEDIEAGSAFTFQIDANYPVASFGGSKSLVLTTNSWIGGQNYFLGISYLAMGSLCLLTALVFLVKQSMCPRKMGSVELLQEYDGAGPTEGNFTVLSSRSKNSLSGGP
ncbi:hypothetical protein AAMO2058_000108000 [Amorphochlora amoebiformis]